jgi:predicted RNA-binding protein
VHTGWLFVGEIQAEAIVSSAKEVDGDLKTIDLNAIFE